jgi:hypothetical protein
MPRSPATRAAPAARLYQRAPLSARLYQRARLPVSRASAAAGAAASASQLAEHLAAAAELLAFARVSIDEGDGPLASLDGGERLSVSSVTPSQLAAAVSLLQARASAAASADGSGDDGDCGIEWDGFDACAATALGEYEAAESSGPRPAAAASSQDARLAELLQALADSAPPAAAENAKRSASGSLRTASAPKPLSWPSSGGGGAQSDMSRLEASRRDL